MHLGNIQLLRALHFSYPSPVTNEPAEPAEPRSEFECEIQLRFKPMLVPVAFHAYIVLFTFQKGNPKPGLYPIRYRGAPTARFTMMLLPGIFAEAPPCIRMGISIGAQITCLYDHVACQDLVQFTRSFFNRERAALMQRKYPTW